MIRGSQAADAAIGAVLLGTKGNEQQIVLSTSNGTLTLEASGDCCSHSWFESWDSDADAGVITELDLAGSYGDNWEEGGNYIQSYFGTIKTTKGRVTWEMRNSSNGYYGGSVDASWQPLSN